MDEQGGNIQGEQRKIRIGGGGEVGQSSLGKKEVKERESGSKLWVILILIVSVIASLVFSMKGRLISPTTVEEEKKVGNEGKKSGGLFGPAEYEFGK